MVLLGQMINIEPCLVTVEVASEPGSVDVTTSATVGPGTNTVDTLLTSCVLVITAAGRTVVDTDEIVKVDVVPWATIVENDVSVATLVLAGRVVVTN